MLYNSTQNAAEVVSAAQAIAQGISKDGGLFVPQEFPKYSAETFNELLKLDYKGRAKKVFADFLSDFTEEEINDCVENAYTKEKFGSDNPAPLAYAKLNGKELNILELWHGPTCAFKDMALQILPHFLTKSLKKTYDGKDAVILVATSGDTGKAALEGFKDVDHTKIIVFYPVDGVSPMQKHQMNTQEGNNVTVCAIKGNFDDAQTGVKKIFTTPEISAKLEANNMLFSSANSINWGRLLPQIVYYISAYCDLVNAGKIAMGDKINVVVPTGNFGNILASYYASIMGLPINKFICASNSNNVLSDFIKTGVYDKNRHFYTTISPSMDILVSSNLERLLYKLSGNNADTTKELMTALKTVGKYEVSDEIKAEIKSKFFGGFCDDEQTKATRLCSTQITTSAILTQRLPLMYMSSMLSRQATQLRLLSHRQQAHTSSLRLFLRLFQTAQTFLKMNLIWLKSYSRFQMLLYLHLLQHLRTKRLVFQMLQR